MDSLQSRWKIVCRSDTIKADHRVLDFPHGANFNDCGLQPGNPTSRGRREIANALIELSPSSNTSASFPSHGQSRCDPFGRITGIPDKWPSVARLL